MHETSLLHHLPSVKFEAEACTKFTRFNGYGLLFNMLVCIR